MSQLSLIVVLGLAAYRVTRFFLRDSLIDAPRLWVYEKLLSMSDPPSRLQPLRDKTYELLDCPYCLSVHFSWMLVLAADLYGSVPLPMITWLAAAGAAMVAWRVVEDDPEVE